MNKEEAFDEIVEVVKHFCETETKEMMMENKMKKLGADSGDIKAVKSVAWSSPLSLEEVYNLWEPLSRAGIDSLELFWKAVKLRRIRHWSEGLVLQWLKGEIWLKKNNR